MLTNLIKLPQIIHDETSAFIAPYQINIPNFITTKLVEAKIITNLIKIKGKKFDKKNIN